MKDGLYVLPSGKASTVVSVVNGIPRAECLAAGGSAEDIKLKLEVLYPNRDFSKATVLNKAVRGAYDRAGFAKSLVKALFSLPKEEMAERLDGFLDAWTEQAESFEASFVMTVMMAPTSYRDASGKAGRVSDLDRGAKTSDLIIRLPGWAKWREAHKANLASNSEDAVLQRAWLNNPKSTEGWEWTKEDAEETASVMNANPAYW